jgi:DnaK suppressor protein
MGDIIDKAQASDELFRQKALDKHFAKNKMATPRKSRLAMTKRKCRGCGEPIPAKRLKANPGAIRCIGCQEEVEKNGEEFLDRE